MDNKLSARQESFCNHFTSDAKGVASEAMRLAGYTDTYARVHCADVLANVGIQARIRELTSSGDNILALTRESIVTKLQQAWSQCDPLHTDKLIKLADQIAKYEGFHSAQRFEDVSQGYEVNRGIRERQLEAQVEQLERKCTQLKSIIEGVEEHETSQLTAATAESNGGAGV